MTTAHRPTWNSAKGKAEPGGVRTVASSLVSAKDQNAHMNLKRRNDNPLFSSRDKLKEELFKRENLLDKQIQLKLKAKEEESLMLKTSRVFNNKNIDLKYLALGNGNDRNIINTRNNKKTQDNNDLLLNEEYSEKNNSIGNNEKYKKINSENKYSNPNNDENDDDSLKDEDEDYEEIKELQKCYTKTKNDIVNNEEDKNDSEEEEDDDNNEHESEEDEEDEDEEDEEEELMKEYQKIKQEKDEKDRLKQLEQTEKIKLRTDEDILAGNPIFAQDYSLKKKWYEDTVFKNQAKIEKKIENRYVNDTIRSDFFKKFINKAIQ